VLWSFGRFGLYLAVALFCCPYNGLWWATMAPQFAMIIVSMVSV